MSRQAQLQYSLMMHYHTDNKSSEGQYSKMSEESRAARIQRKANKSDSDQQAYGSVSIGSRKARKQRRQVEAAGGSSDGTYDRMKPFDRSARLRRRQGAAAETGLYILLFGYQYMH